jgi:hypothetical protein
MSHTISARFRVEIEATARYDFGVDRHSRSIPDGDRDRKLKTL